MTANFSVHFVSEFQDNSIYTFHLCFGKDITKWCKVYTKTNSWFKNHMRNLDNYRQAVESPKSWNFVQKLHSFSYNIYRGFIRHYFQLLAWKFTKWLMSFLKPYVIFHDTAPLYIKLKIFRLVTALIKIHQIPHVIFGTKS